MGCDHGVPGLDIIRHDFNPRIPYGMRRIASDRGNRLGEFQSTHPVWDATDGGPADKQTKNISIHASRMGCDLCQIMTVIDGKFQSTHPVWDATGNPTLPTTVTIISIHASRMGCDACAKRTIADNQISIHASRMGCDMIRLILVPLLPDFNPRIPYGMRPGRQGRGMGRPDISIHASRMGCDWHRSILLVQEWHFNPRIPYGMRRRRAGNPQQRRDISIHASRMGCDALRIRSGAG